MSLVRGQIDDFVVASFPCPPSASAARTPTRTAASQVGYTSSAKTDHRVAVASPRVGMAVYDLEDQTPLSSISVGPSFTPTTAPVARSTPLSQTESESARVKSVRKTWVGVETSDRAAEIWCFHEDENRDGSTPSADAPKAVWPVSEPIAALAAPRTLPNHVAFLSETGTLALAPQDDLTRLVSLPAPPRPAIATNTVSQTLRLVPLTASANGGSAAEFLPASLLAALPSATTTTATPHLAVVVRSYAANAETLALATGSSAASLTWAGKKKHKKQSRPSAASVIDAAEASSSSLSPAASPLLCEIELVLLDAAISVPDEFEPRQGLVRLGRVGLPGASQVVVSDEGFVTSLNTDGTLSSHRLGFTSSLVVDTYPTLFFPVATSSADDLSPLLDLSVSLVKSVALSTTALTPSRSTLLALHSSFVALASPRPRTPPPAASLSSAVGVAAADSTATAVSITYWDTRFGSVIAATELAVPSAVASNPDQVSVSLARAGRRTAIVILEPDMAPATESASAVESATSAATAAKRTVLFGLPLNGLPSASVLAAVVGKHTLTGRYLAPPSSLSSSSAAAAVLEQARRAEPLRSQLTRSGNEKKATLLETSRLAREQVLDSLAAILEPLRSPNTAGAEQDQAVSQAELAWERYINGERDRLLEYNQDKVRLAMEKEKERRVAAIGGGSGQGQVLADEDDGTAEAGEATRYKVAKRKIERALAAAGAPVRLRSGAGERGEKSWKDVTAARIKGVNDKYRYRYHLERDRKEAEMGKTVKEFDWEEAVNKVQRYEPSLPASFVTALLRLSFPVPLADSSASVEIAAPPPPGTPKLKQQAPVIWRHPTAMVGYLLGRELVGENQVEGGVTRFLARAGDWPNILVALRTVPDIPESTLVSLLVGVVRAVVPARATVTDEMEVDASSSALPAAVPSLPTFLAAFLQSPYTPSVLRQALQKQLSPDEAVVVLEQCDDWLRRWLSDAEPVERHLAEDEKRKQRKGKGSRAVAVDVFKVAIREGDVPTMNQIVPFVQAVLDAHLLNLLLQRQAHRLLRRLAQHVARHAELTTDLGTLLGALSIYPTKKKEDQRRSAAAAAAAGASLPDKKAPAVAVAGVKEFGATMEKRILAQEKHAEVGQYQVEEFFL
ncbi:hypothetical protein JCM3774_000964 [Rhodotorula dairenensis]